MTRPIVSDFDRALGARIVRRVAMHYADGADASVDRPGHVRAASSMAWVGARVALVQDDANFIALVDPESGLANAITLPAGKDDLRQFDVERGNKKHKLDLEALTRVPTADGPMLLALGSGSKKRREHVVTLRAANNHADAMVDAAPELVPLPALYASLRATTAFAGSDMNIEGALYVNGVVRLFARGNGKATDDLQPVDATCDLDWRALHDHIAAPTRAAVPAISRVTQYALGAIDDVPLGFTDAIVVRRALVMYSAAAEASPDASEDGDVGGSALGVLPNDRRQGARWTQVRDETGAPFRGKVEGLVLHPRDSMRAFVVVDVDDHRQPSELCEVVLSGPWWSR